MWPSLPGSSGKDDPDCSPDEDTPRHGAGQGIDGLAGTMEGLAMDPFSGSLFVFRNRRGTSLKVFI
jgi:hypothetical protein